MDAQAVAMLAAMLGPALFKAFEKVLEKGVVDPALEKGLEPFQKWLTGGYDRAKDAEALRGAVGAALDDLEKDQQVGGYGRLVASLKLTGLDEKQLDLLAAAAVEMADFRPEALPLGLLNALDLDETRRDLLARFLFYLHRRLAGVEKYKDGVALADRLAGRGLLAGLTQQVIALQARADRLVSIEDALIGERRLLPAGEDARALRIYLETMRQSCGDLNLPLIRKRSGEAVQANLKQFFVPLRLRDARAERRSSERRSRKSGRLSMADRQFEQEGGGAERPAGMGDLLNRYTTFILIGPPGCGKSTLLHRVALAFAEGRAGEDLGWAGKPLLPVLARLRNFGAFLSQRAGDFPEPAPGALVAYLDRYFRVGLRKPLTADFFDRRLAEGGCLVLLDGLDEVSENRAQVAQQVNAFAAPYARLGNRIGLASRPRGYESVEWHLRPAGLAEADVLPLDQAGIRQLTGNLLALIEANARQRGRDAERLAQAIFNSAELTEVAGTPLFCSALVQVYKYHGAELPQRRVDVFDEIVDLLLGFWRAQQSQMADAERLAKEDGTGRQFRDLNEAVMAKRRRLCHLAYQMQENRQAEIPRQQAVDSLARFLLERERAPDADTACTWAENFLLNSHEHSGLLVETSPEIYAFTHKGFLEFLAATALVNRSQELVKTILAHLGDDWWEQVLLLAGAHPRLAEDLRSELVNRILDEAEGRDQAVRVDVGFQVEPGGKKYEFKNGGLSLRCLLVAGKLAYDMADYLPGPEHQQVEQALHRRMIDPELKPEDRASAADALDALGWQPPDLYEFVSIDDGQPVTVSSKLWTVVSHPFYLGKYPVSNAQYARFLQAEDFADRELWVNFARFDQNSRTMQETWGEAGWRWLQEKLKDADRSPDGRVVYPKYWNDPRLGIARRGAPVVGITWYEASAYCRWLERNWAALEEGRANPGWQPGEVRLPTETEWVLAAGGDQPGERYPWDLPGKATDDLREILRRANVDESQIGRTTPAGMYPLGASQPYGLWDMAGNVWEWTASDRGVLALRGGAWYGVGGYARLSVRGGRGPVYEWLDALGFRVLARPY